MSKNTIKKCPTCETENDVRAQNCSKCNALLLGVLSTPSIPRPGNSPMPGPSPHSQGIGATTGPKKPFCLMGIVAVIIIVLAGGCVSAQTLFSHLGTIFPNTSSTPPSTALMLPQGLGVTQAPNGDMVGVNDGSYPPFDMRHDKSEVALKQKAAQTLHNGDGAGAVSLWKSALKIESNDAEALIYAENQRIRESGKPYRTLIAGVAFLDPNDPSPQRQLQGIYVAQQENNSASSGFKLRVLIASSGSEVSYVSSVAKQIAQMASQDNTIVGVIGWLTSSRSHEALSILANAKIPQVSPQASDDGLSGISPYFFRVVPPNEVQAQAAAQFAKQTLNIKNPVVFLDPKDNYSQNLAEDFEARFVKGGNSKPHEEMFTADKTKDFSSLVQDALKYNPDGFYFTSSSNSDTALFQDALPTSEPFATLPVISGDAGYVAHKNSYDRWFFTDFAYPDAWGIVVGKNSPSFFQHYSTYFNPYGQKPDGYYGYTRADDHAILSYDATSVLLAGIQIALANGKTTPTTQDLANSLPQIKGDQALQGVSGQIAFDDKHDPINKAVVFLYTSADGHLQMKSIQGCFLKGCP